MGKVTHLVFKDGQKRQIDRALRFNEKNARVRLQPIACKRRHERIRYMRKVSYGTRHRSFTGLIKDLSHSGVFIETNFSFPEGTKILVTIPFANKVGNVSISGWVVRKDTEGVGIEFLK